MFLLCRHPPTRSPPLAALLMLEENICSMSSFPSRPLPGCRLLENGSLPARGGGPAMRTAAGARCWPRMGVLAPWQGRSSLYPALGGSVISHPWLWVSAPSWGISTSPFAGRVRSKAVSGEGEAM